MHSCLELCFCQDQLTQFLVVFSCTKYIHLVPSFSQRVSLSSVCVGLCVKGAMAVAGFVGQV